MLTEEIFKEDVSSGYTAYILAVGEAKKLKEENSRMEEKIRELLKEQLESKDVVKIVRSESSQQVKGAEEALHRSETARAELTIKLQEKKKEIEELRIRLGQVSSLQQQVQSLRIYLNDANAKCTTEATLRGNSQKQLDIMRTKVQTLVKEKKHYLEKISGLQEECKQCNLKTRLAETESRRLKREIEELDFCKIQLGKFQALTEDLSLENLQLQKSLRSLREKFSQARSQLRAYQTEESSASTDKNSENDTDEHEEQLLVTRHGQLRIDPKADPSRSSDSRRKQERKRKTPTEDYRLMCARSVKIEYPDVDITFDQLVNMARDLNFWEVYPFYIQTMKSLKMKDANERNGGTANLFNKVRSLFGANQGMSPTAGRQSPTARLFQARAQSMV